MRILMILCLSLCAGSIVSLIPVDGTILLIAAGILFLLFLLLLLFFRKHEKRLMLIFLGLSLGILTGWGYKTTVFSPAMEYVDLTQEITGEVTSYSNETAYGIWFEAKLFLPETAAKAAVWLRTDEALKPGDHFTATLRLKDSHTGDSYYNYSQGIFLSAYGTEDAVIVPCDAVPVRYFPKYIAHRLEESLKQAFPSDTYGFAAALTTGNRNDLSDISVANLKSSGIYHAVALSGMHLVVLLGMVDLLVLKRKRLKSILGIPIAIFFTIITGCVPSMVRATVMQCLMLSAALFRREKDWPTSLSLALAVLMAENPWCILNWGLQLSFLSVLGIELFSQRLLVFFMGNSGKSRPIRYRVRRFLASSFAATCSAMVMTIPLLAVYFGFISMVSPITNLLTDMVISVCFGGSLITALLGLLFPGGASVLGWLLSWCFRYVDTIAGFMARLPFSQLYTNSFYSILWLILLYVLIFILASKQRRKIIPICCGISSFAVCILLIFLEGMTPAFTALDVGQGQCLLMHNRRGDTVMVDCGGNNGNAGDIAAGELAAMGKTSLDILILTHFDSDHVNGVPELLRRIPVDRLIIPDVSHESRNEITAIAENLGTEVYVTDSDLEITLGGDHITIFGPLTVGDPNESGLSLLASIGSMDILITGDMEMDTELRLLGEQEIPDVDILVAGHHGSRNSTGEKLLTTSAPEYVIISIGDNRYGHPHEETIGRIETAGAVIYRTDETGSITIKGE